VISRRLLLPQARHHRLEPGRRPVLAIRRATVMSLRARA
jgi:hypothetical protein